MKKTEEFLEQLGIKRAYGDFVLNGEYIGFGVANPI